jgi:two-component system CheB/CheR fusion protein
MNNAPKVNVLLVDDQPAKLMTYEVILEPLGENLVKASSGSEALRHLLERDFAVVVMDVCMPNGDGFELARMIQDHPRLHRTAIILVSAVFMTDVDQLKGYDSGAVDYVPVPIVPEALRAKVRVFATLWRKSEQLRQLNLELERRVALRTADLENTTANLRKTEERFRFLAETIPSMLWISAVDGTITYANRRWLDYRGLTALPPDCQWSDSEVHSEDRDSWLSAWAMHLESGKRLEIEARHRRHDGTYRWFMTGAAPRRTESGELICWFGVTTDIHDHKVLQQQLRASDRRKDEFLAVLGHELRNPLAPIRNAVQLLHKRVDTHADLVWCRDVIERQTEHMTRLVEDLLDVARITTGKVRLQRETLDIAQVVAGAVETNRPLLEARDHCLSVEGPEQPLWVDGDAMRLGQVFANLVNNSSKYTDNGGRITIRIAAEPRAEGGGDDVVVRVIDTGAGIPEPMLPALFNLFTQGERASEQMHSGLGVGLALVRTFVHMHRGVVEVYSEGAGKGSEFVVRLPRVAAPRVPAPRASVPSDAASEPAACADRCRRILVVDDNVDSTDTLAMLLRCHGHEVHTAFDGLAAVAAVEQLRPDVVLLDLRMPQMNGFEAAQQIRRQPWGKSILLVAQTGCAQEEDRQKAIAAGFDHHMTKPLNTGDLLQLLARRPCAGASPAAGSDPGPAVQGADDALQAG